ncbi:hypothetical protein [Rhizobium sp. SSA_523]|uniref:hypothetical protein n=1 Tax=Rhizobium sp. SSA_523 TaxID=2952477 RepID=UPI00209121E9|nr:hypothetical protein [Rhizobium sp. SSA_523]MCO5733636.1 hypothetical protein [Rhizobium sp. SSA_523]WKC23068.1 hypothetical protein QTJ18_19875 [Rhizobium sp. SSA_523]
MVPAEAVRVRNLVASCGWREALEIPKALFGYVESVLDAAEPGVYLIDLLPPLTSSMHAFLAGIGAFTQSPVQESEIAQRRVRLLEYLDAFIDEARLHQRSVDFVHTMKAGQRKSF